MKTRLTYLLAAILVATGCHNSNPPSETQKTDSIKVVVKDTLHRMPDTPFGPGKTIADNISLAVDFDVFFGLLEEVHLDSLLKTAGPYTLFLPGNEAFKRMPGLDESLSKPNKRKELKEFLLNHIVSAKALGVTFLDGQKIKTMGGHELTISKKGDSLTVNGIAILKSDIQCSNGIIHVIDQVITEKK